MIWGSASSNPRQKPPQKRGRGLRVNRRTTRPAFLRALRPRNSSLLSLPSENGITVFNPGEAVPNAH